MKECIYFLNCTFLPAMIIGFLLPTVAISTNENKESSSQYLERYYSAYITSCFIMERIAIFIYNYISSNLGDIFLIQSGIILTILLILTGMLIEKFGNVIKVRKKEEVNKELETKYIRDADKVFIMGVVTLVLAAEALLFDYKISLLCISLILGKYFWIDSGLISIRENCSKMKRDWLSINKQVKKICLRFTLVLLISSYIGNILYNRFEKTSYIFSMYVAISLIVIMVCFFKKRRD